MVVRVSEISPSEPEALLHTLQGVAKDQTAFFFVVCLNDPHDARDRSVALEAVVNEAQRRMNGRASTREHLCAADLRMDRNRHEVMRAGRHIQLSPMEYALLEFLMLHQDRALTEDRIMRSVFSTAPKNGRFNTLWVHIHRVRRKVDLPGLVPLIHTIKGVGYILRSPRTAAEAASA